MDTNITPRQLYAALAMHANMTVTFESAKSCTTQEQLEELKKMASDSEIAKSSFAMADAMIEAETNDSHETKPH